MILIELVELEHQASGFYFVSPVNIKFGTQNKLVLPNQSKLLNSPFNFQLKYMKLALQSRQKSEVTGGNSLFRRSGDLTSRPLFRISKLFSVIMSTGSP